MTVSFASNVGSTTGWQSPISLMGLLYVGVVEGHRGEMTKKEIKRILRDYYFEPILGGLSTIERLCVIRADGKTVCGSKCVGGGFRCCGCGEYNHYAEPNQSDGGFKCYSCRR